MGANGSGKSSLLNAIVGLYNSDIIGDIYYDNYSIKALDVYTLRRTLIGFCEQTPIVFDDTIRYNIYLDSVHNDTVIGNKLISILHLRGLFDKLEKVSTLLSTIDSLLYLVARSKNNAYASIGAQSFYNSIG